MKLLNRDKEALIVLVIILIGFCLISINWERPLADKITDHFSPKVIKEKESK